MTTDHIEIEIKLKLAEKQLEDIRRRLWKMDFALACARSFEQNIVLDTPDKELKKSKRLLRLRQVSGQNILTFKRPAHKTLDTKGYKVREELEIEVSDMQTARNIFSGLGYDVFFIYEKYRETYKTQRVSGPVSIMLDQTPMGDFMEIEGDATSIDEIAHSLGFNKNDYITANYYTLFRKLHKTGYMQFS